ncbi:hypothetical protein ES705_34638 [subsurface metagenome]
MTITYLNTLDNPDRVVKSARPDGLGTLIRAERTPGAVAVSVIRGRAGEREPIDRRKPFTLSVNLSPGISKTNSRPSVKTGVFSIYQAVSLLLLGANPLHGAVLGPQQE